MKCPSCGAEIGNNKFCEYCGSQITAEMQKEQEQLNKDCCPKCGSTNIQFQRENQGEVRSENTKRVIHYTIGFCKDCGYTWRADGKQKEEKRKTWLWVLGWICIFPLPLTLILLKKKDMKPALKYGIIAAAWIIYLLIGFAGMGSTPDEPVDSDEPAIVIEEEQTDESNTANVEDVVKETEAESITQKEETVSTEYKSALKKAEIYSKSMHMSKQAIYDQLTSDYGECFPADAAQYAIDNLEADYNDNALKKAESYSKDMHMSKKGIYEQLISEYGEQFTPEEAQYAIDHLAADYKLNALEKAKSYQDSMSMSKSAIYDQLISDYGEQFTPEEAQYAIDNLN